MATFIILLVFLVTPAQLTTASGRRQVDNDIDYQRYSDDEYELPKFWEEQFSNLAPLHTKPAARQKNFPTTKKQTTVKTAPRTTKKSVFDVSKLYFPSLESYAVLAKPVTENKYPWIAKVVHSRYESYPYVCTAVCIEQRIFITAARCIATLKISFTSVIYERVQFLAKVFVTPDKPTKQLFDDIALIVVYDNNVKYKGKWPTVKLFDGKRKDDQFKWFDDLNYTQKTVQHKVIGYTVEKRVFKFKVAQTIFKLTELPVLVDINLCEEVFSKGNVVARYHVPCYHFCNRSMATKCTSYHGTEGGAVFNFRTQRLLGLATWGVFSYTSYDLPVGFSVPNSDSFHKDLACARTIRADRNTQPQKGYYQSLCGK